VYQLNNNIWEPKNKKYNKKYNKKMTMDFDNKGHDITVCIV